LAGRRTNLALLVLLPLAGLTGLGCFLVGSGVVGPVVAAHGMVGLGLLALSPWKSAVARRGLRRTRPGRADSLALAVLVVVALATGLLHSMGLLVRVRDVPVLTVHVGAGLAALLPAVAHVRRRRVRPRRADLSRRAMLRLALLGGGAGVLYRGLEASAAALSLPGADRRATGSYELSSDDPAGMPVTSWLLDEVPALDPAVWRLTVTSHAGRRDWALAELRELGASGSSAILDCTGGWWSRQRWTGVRLADLLPPGATGSVEVVSATAFVRRHGHGDVCLHRLRHTVATVLVSQGQLLQANDDSATPKPAPPCGSTATPSRCTTSTSPTGSNNSSATELNPEGFIAGLHGRPWALAFPRRSSYTYGYDKPCRADASG